MFYETKYDLIKQQLVAALYDSSCMVSVNGSAGLGQASTTKKLKPVILKSGTLCNCPPRSQLNKWGLLPEQQQMDRQFG